MEDEPIVLYGVGQYSPGGFRLEDIQVIEETGALIVGLPLVTLDLFAGDSPALVDLMTTPAPEPVIQAAFIPRGSITPIMLGPGNIPRIEPVPEPPTWIGVGAVGLLMWKARR